MKITGSALREIHQHLEAAYPDEGCGFLLGSPQTDEVVVTAARAANNHRSADRAARTRYLITPDEFRTAEGEARRTGRSVVGTYHSHPDVPALPSDYDREHAWPWYRYLILSIRAGRVAEQRAWELRDDRSGFIEHPIIEDN